MSTYREFPEHAHNILWEPGWEKVTEYVHEWIEAISKGKGMI